MNFALQSRTFFLLLHFILIIFFLVCMTNVATCVLLILDSSRRMLNCTSVVRSSPSTMTILVWMVCLGEQHYRIIYICLLMTEMLFLCP